MIAFVVVASVFAMTTLQTGLFAAAQGQETAYAGLDHATGSLQLRGSVRAIRGDVDVDANDTIDLGGVDDQAVAKVIFTVTGAIGSSLTDLTPPFTTNGAGVDPDASGLEDRTSITINTDTMLINDAAWTVTFPGSDNGDFFLDDDEKAELTVWLHSYDNANALYDLGAGTGDPYVDAAADLIGAGQDFTIKLHPAKGSTLTIQRAAPVVLRPQMDLR